MIKKVQDEEAESPLLDAHAKKRGRCVKQAQAFARLVKARCREHRRCRGRHLFTAGCPCDKPRPRADCSGYVSENRPMIPSGSIGYADTVKDMSERFSNHE